MNKRAQFTLSIIALLVFVFFAVLTIELVPYQKICQKNGYQKVSINWDGTLDCLNQIYMPIEEVAP